MSEEGGGSGRAYFHYHFPAALPLLVLGSVVIMLSRLLMIQ